MTGRIPAGRPVWQPPAQQVTTGADRGQRIVVEIQRDEMLLQVDWATIEAFGKWPAPSAFVGGSNATSDWIGFGRTGRDQFLALVIAPFSAHIVEGSAAVNAKKDAKEGAARTVARTLPGQLRLDAAQRLIPLSVA